MATVLGAIHGCAHFPIAETTEGVDYVAERAQRHANAKVFQIGAEKGCSITVLGDDEGEQDVGEQLAITLLSDISDLVVFELVTPPPGGDSVWFAFAYSVKA